MTDQLLQALLKLRIARVAHGDRETHDGAFADAYLLAQPGRGHVYRLVVVLRDVFGDPAMAFAQPASAAVQAGDQILRLLHNFNLGKSKLNEIIQHFA